MTAEVISSFIPLIIIIGVVIIIIVVLWQGMSVAKTEIGGKQTTKYEKLAEQAIESGQKSSDAQQKTAETLEDIRARLTAIEKLLSEVQ